MICFYQRIIDVLKVDVEGAEWPFLRNLVDNDAQTLRSVRQLLIELHTPRYSIKNESMTSENFVEVLYYFTRLRKNGFQLYRNVQRNNCCGHLAAMMPPKVQEKCCHESFYINTKLSIV